MDNTIFHPGKILKKSELYYAGERCHICLSRAKRKSVFSLQEDPEVSLLFCENCKGLSADYMPTEQALIDYYKDYYYHYDSTHNKITFQDPERFAKHILKFMEIKNFDDEIRILDFGGGDGSLALAAAEFILKDKDIFIDITVVDYHTHTQKGYEKKNINIKYGTDINILHGKYNIVLASAILEHIPEVNPVLKKLFSFVAPGGYFYARTPDRYALKKIIKSLDFKFPQHVHDMGSSFWNRIVETFNIDAVIVSSKPSIVQTEFKKAFLMTLAAYLFKIPAYIEQILFEKKKDMLWKFSGGWEIVLKMN